MATQLSMKLFSTTTLTAPNSLSQKVSFFSPHPNIEGANVTVADVDGVTPLHLSCHKASTVLVQTLLRKGAKVDEVDGLGQTPLLVAANACISSSKEEHANYLECIQYLLEANANVNVVDRNKNSCLHLAAMSGNELLITLLLKKPSPSGKNSP